MNHFSCKTSISWPSNHVCYCTVMIGKSKQEDLSLWLSLWFTHGLLFSLRSDPSGQIKELLWPVHIYNWLRENFQDFFDWIYNFVRILSLLKVNFCKNPAGKISTYCCSKKLVRAIALLRFVSTQNIGFLTQIIFWQYYLNGLYFSNLQILTKLNT